MAIEASAYFYYASGTVLAITSIVFLSFYIPFLMVLWSNDFRRVTAYRVLLAVGLTDCVQLVIHVISSITVIFQLDIPLPIGKILGASMYSTYCSTMSLYILLSLNHLIYVIFPRFAIDLCTGGFVWVLMAATLLVFAVFLVLKCLPSINFIFDPAAIQWITPSHDHAISHILKDYSNWIIAVYVGLSAIIYTAIFLHIKIARNNKTSRRERIMVLQLQTFCSLLCLICAFIYWQFINPALQHTSAVPGFISGALWLLMNGANPIVYMIINKSLRNGFQTLLSKRSSQIAKTEIFQSRRQAQADVRPMQLPPDVAK